MTEKEFEVLLQRFLKDECTPGEKKVVLDWYDQISFSSKEEYVPNAQLENRLWASVQNGISEDEPKKATTLKLGYAWRIAAGILLVAIVGRLFFLDRVSDPEKLAQRTSRIIQLSPVSKTVHNNSEVAQVIILEDGSSIILEPDSKLQYPETFLAEKREVYLEGEAFFEIARDTLRPFYVYANNVVTRVLGTSFTIKARNQAKDVSISVRTGKVMVYKKTEQENSTIDNEVILTPNQKVVYNGSTDEITKSIVEKPQIVVVVPSLRMAYVNAPVVKIFEAIEKAYNVDLIFDAEVLNKCTITTDLANEDLYDRLDILCHALGAQYKLVDTTIYIESNGCE